MRKSRFLLKYDQQTQRVYCCLIPIKSGLPFTPIDLAIDMAVVMAFHSHFKFSATCVDLNKDEKQLLFGKLPDHIKPVMCKLGLK